MKMTKLLAAAALAIMCASACASGPAFSEFQATMPTLKPADGRLWFYRTSALGAAVQPDVKLNGETVGKSVAGGFFYVDRSPGQYKASASTEAERDLSLTLGAGEQKYIRMEPQMGLFVGTMKLVPVDTAVGQKEIAGTKFSGPTK